MLKHFVIAAAISSSQSFQQTRYNTAIDKISSTALSSTEDATRKPGQYLPTHKRYADHLMQSESFRTSLRSDEDLQDDAPSSSSSTFPHPEIDRVSVYDEELETQMIRDVKSLNAILNSREYKSSLTQDDEKLESDDDEELVDFTEEMFIQHAALSDLMDSSKFRHSLDVNDDDDATKTTSADKKPYHAPSTATQDEILQEQHPQEFNLLSSKYNLDLLHQQAELSDFMKHDTERHTKEQEFDSSLEMVMARGALSDVLRSNVFRSSLHPNKEDQGEYHGGLMHVVHVHNDAVEMGLPHAEMADSHLHTLLVGEDDEEGFVATDYDFDLAMLRGKAALNKVMGGMHGDRTLD